MERRQKVIGTVADSLPQPEGAPVLIAIDGPDASGKTTLRKELGAELRSRGRDVIEVSMDDFHHPREHRYRQGRESARGFWEDSFDHEAFIEKVLGPLGRDGDRVVALRHHDLESDELLTDTPAVRVGEEVTLLADGLFMQHPGLAQWWHAVVWVDAPFSVRFARMVERDGLKDDPDDPLQRRYFDGQLIYRREVAPRDKALIVVDNTDPKRARVLPRDEGEAAPQTALGRSER